MNAVENFRDTLKSGKICLGASIGFSDPLVSMVLTNYFDFIWLELEHCAMSPEVIMGHFIAGFSKNVPTFVRVPGSSTHIIKPILDSGASGIIVPQVKNAEEVRRIVEDCRYPPLGKRGFGPRIPSDFGRENINNMIEWTNSNIFVAVMIENLSAVNSIDEILKVPGLDSVVIGPMDLSGSLGLLGKTDHPEVTAAIDMVIARAHAAGIIVGAGVPADADVALSMINRGVQWLQLGNDFHYLTKFAENITSSIRTQLKGAKAKAIV